MADEFEFVGRIDETRRITQSDIKILHLPRIQMLHHFPFLFDTIAADLFGSEGIGDSGGRFEIESFFVFETMGSVGDRQRHFAVGDRKRADILDFTAYHHAFGHIVSMVLPFQNLPFFGIFLQCEKREKSTETGQ